MFGNKKCLLLIIIVFSLLNFLQAGGRIPAKDFRIGMNIEGGVKFIGPVMFHGKSGIIFKFGETFSLIPYVGIYPDETVEKHSHWEQERYYDPQYGGYLYRDVRVVDKYKNDTETIDAGITLRFEYPRKIVRMSTAYEYDPIEQKFLHHYYYSAFRPFWQIHIGSFVGLGGGFLYYFNESMSLGFNLDTGYNFAAEEGFGVSPKLVIAISI